MMRGVCGLVYVQLFVTIVNAKLYFKEDFSEPSWEKRWIQSTHKSDYGKFELSSGKVTPDKDDKGLKTSQDAKFYALSSGFSPFSNKGKKFVVSFTIKQEQGIDCGGGYIKLMKADVDQKEFSGVTPYLVMFGPDICGPGTKKVHVILSHKEKNYPIKKEIACKDDEVTHVYTLVISPDNSYEVLIDGEKVESGDIESDFGMLPPKRIKDPDAKKPDDWDEVEHIPDPDDKKPGDWEKPEHIPDPDAKKPDDWDDEMDGEWEPPMIDNPDYKGDWKPKLISNPAYKGTWIHPEIDNPNYKPDDRLYLMENIGKIAFDLWQVRSGSIFDNIMIGDSVEEVQDFIETYRETVLEPEKKLKEQYDEEQRKKTEEEMKKLDEQDKKVGEDEEEEGDDDDGMKEDEEDHDEL